MISWSCLYVLAVVELGEASTAGRSRCGVLCARFGCVGVGNVGPYAGLHLFCLRCTDAWCLPSGYCCRTVRNVSVSVSVLRMITMKKV